MQEGKRNCEIQALKRRFKYPKSGCVTWCHLGTSGSPRSQDQAGRGQEIFSTSCSYTSSWVGFRVSFSFFWVPFLQQRHTKEASCGLVSRQPYLLARAKGRASYKEAVTLGLCPGLGHFSGSLPLPRDLSEPGLLLPPTLFWVFWVSVVGSRRGSAPFPCSQPHASGEGFGEAPGGAGLEKTPHTVSYKLCSCPSPIPCL